MNLEVSWRRVVVWFGVVALVDAALVALPLPVVPDAVDGLVPPVVVPALALVAAGLAGRTLLRARREEAPARVRPPQLRDEEAGVERVGADVDDAFDALGADGTDDEWSHANAARTVRSELRRAVREALVANGHAREEAHRLIEAGTWTDDERAAAFLGDRPLPLWMRVRDWASGAGERRRAAAAAEELLVLVRDEPDREPADPSARRRRARGGAGAPTGTGREELAELEVDA